MKNFFKIRMMEWLVAAIALSALVFFLFPHQLPVSLYKLSLIALAAVAAYWIDRSLFPYARPDSFYQSDEFDIEADVPLRFDQTPTTPSELLFAVAQIRRAIIVAAAMIAIGLGA